MDIQAVDQFAQQLIKEAARRIRESFSYDLHVETKSSDSDLVTNVDRETELFFIEQIKTFDATHRILAEEGMGEQVTDLTGVVWVIDPIDGTMNFVKQHRHFMISVGVLVDGVGKLGYIFDVMREDLFHAIAGVGAWYNGTPLRKLENLTIEQSVIGINARWVTENKYVDYEQVSKLVRTVRGTRSYGSAAMEIAFVVSGKLDAYMSMRLAPWDIAGGVIIANEVGAVTSTLAGEPVQFLQSNTFIIANPSIHPILLDQYIHLLPRD
ncbi:inositol monophosphatase family protein [Caryophanon latum]|uniref:inositol-phosphate phosphatase n=1 Tax=Caryophanon latum TaxID=33977 RepID=A0A1C0YUU1_9BACL|nr:inositol monophosphatase family protein [Caryophanon latum]OCS90938.1 inositol monophosphatase [Caryophanon latum]